jgi:hypothetical protein
MKKDTATDRRAVGVGDFWLSCGRALFFFDTRRGSLVRHLHLQGILVRGAGEWWAGMVDIIFFLSSRAERTAIARNVAIDVTPRATPFQQGA